MKCLRSISAVAFAASIGFGLLPNLQADNWNKKTTVNITEPLQVPSCCTPGHTITLEPGEYVIALKDSLADRHIVQIFDKGQQHLLTTILAIPNYRLQPTGKTVFQLWEVPTGQPAALRAWFYPGDNFGQEFAYPKQKAVELAAYVKTPVPAIEVETNAVEDLKTAPVVVVDESGKTAEPALTMRPADPALRPAMEVAAYQPPAAERTVAAQTPAAAETPAPIQRLPQTATVLPLVGLAGLLSLVLFAVIEFRSRRRPIKA